MRQTIQISNFKKNLDTNKKNIKPNIKNYFIGLWCLDLKDILNGNHNDVLDMYLPNNIKKFDKDIDYLIKNYNLMLNMLYKNLNKIHGTNYKKSFWEILIGRWLITWINQVYFRWEYINKINKKYKIKKFIISQDALKNTTPINTEHAHKLIRQDDKWSEFTFLQIMKYKNDIKTKIIVKKNKNRIEKLDNRYSQLNYPKFAIYNNFSKVFFYNFELNFKARLKFQKNLNFYFLSYSSTKTLSYKDDKLRNNFENLLNNSKKKNFFNFLIDNVKFNIPKIFLENFSDLKKIYSISKWPMNVEYILTSYGHYYDEPFKFYIANQKKKSKLKLCILQHGYGNMFTKNDYYNVYLDRKISDMYLSWGKLKKNKNLPFFYPRLSGSKINEFKFNMSKNILLISYSFSGTLHYPPDGSKNGNIINYENLSHITSLVDNIDSNISKRIYVKNQNINATNNFEYLVKRKNPLIKFINENKKLLNIIEDYNLYIHIFFGTPFFECMTLNKPTIIIYNKNNHQPFDRKFKNYIKKLEKEKILFKNEKMAANFLNSNYINLEKWWNKKSLQKLRNKFCSDYCFYADKETKIFKNLGINN
jgi:putative transferase (TIGR04331 family)|tara:strand:+ start:1361 stop:3127 length:1767 start_codon:yes stop_codon:yes gene_type:complete